ncbi:MAG: endonuclease/exonuclease/phosphatase family protein [Acidimicrobiales bacterium]
MRMRVATYNIRNGRAIDLSSFWWMRRRAVRAVIARIDADIWGLQEAYGFQRRHLERTVLPDEQWGSAGDGRHGGGRGEQVPILYRRAAFAEASASTRWFGPTPEVAGSVVDGAAFPRIATVADLTMQAGGVVRVVNVHLDSDSSDRREAALRQLVDWLDELTEAPTIVMGDFNGTLHDPGYDAFAGARLRTALPADTGPTSNGFGRYLGAQRQIDHVLVSEEFTVRSARIDVESGHASDHYPVVVDLEL